MSFSVGENIDCRCSKKAFVWSYDKLEDVKVMVYELESDHAILKPVVNVEKSFVFH